MVLVKFKYQFQKSDKMKTLLIVLIGMISSTGLLSQEWFPVGASWYYNQINFLEGESYVHFEVTGEIVIQGKTCKEVSGGCACGVPGIGGYLCQEGDRIFSYDFETDTFRILYDFTLEAGDTLVVQGDPEIGGDGLFLIDSITFIQLGTENLRVQHITHLSSDIEWGNKIIERIGSNGCLYPQVGFCDPLTGGLRCYEDDETGLINFQMPPRPCDYITSATEIDIAEPVLQVYPNPATNSIHIQTESTMDMIVLFNNLSTPVYQKSGIFNTDYELDVSKLPAGIYYLRIVASGYQQFHRSVVIQK
jgi:hypothetical protein